MLAFFVCCCGSVVNPPQSMKATNVTLVDENWRLHWHSLLRSESKKKNKSFICITRPHTHTHTSNNGRINLVFTFVCQFTAVPWSIASQKITPSRSVMQPTACTVSPKAQYLHHYVLNFLANHRAPSTLQRSGIKTLMCFSTNKKDL